MKPTKTRWWLHDHPVKLIGPGSFGMAIVDNLGHCQWVFAPGQAVYNCLKQKPETLPDGDNHCPNCTWARLIHKCHGSCNMEITKGGCG